MLKKKLSLIIFLTLLLSVPTFAQKDVEENEVTTVEKTNNISKETINTNNETKDLEKDKDLIKKEFFNPYISNNNTLDTFDFYEDKIRIKSYHDKTSEKYHEPIIPSSIYVPKIQDKIYAFLKNNMDDKRFSLLEYNQSPYEKYDQIIMTYSNDKKVCEDDNYYYRFYLNDKCFYDANRDWSNKELSNKVSFTLDIKNLSYNEEQSKHKCDKQLVERLRKTIEGMFEEQGKNIMNYILDKYKHAEKETPSDYYPQDTKIFGDVQVDYVQSEGQQFYFSYIKQEKEQDDITLTKEFYQPNIDNGSTIDTFDFYDDKIMIKSYWDKDQPRYHEPIFPSSDYVPEIDKKINAFLKNNMDDKRFSLVELWDDKTQENEDKIVMTYAYNYGFYKSYSQYYQFFLENNNYYNAKADWKKANFSDKVSICLNVKRLIEVDGSTKGKVEQELVDKLTNTIKSMFPEQGKDISDWILYKYDHYILDADPLDLPKDTKTFGNIQVDYVQFQGDDFYFSFN